MLALQNRCFASLPLDIRAFWRPHMSLLEFKKGDSLPLNTHNGVIWFPIDCVATMSARSGDRPAAFMRFSGNNFVIGVADLLKAGSVKFEGIICGKGHAFSLPLHIFLQTFPTTLTSASLSTIAMAKLAEKGLYLARCANAHTARQRLARVLLEASEAFGETRPITLSQQELSEILLVRRETVAIFMAEWSSAGMLAYSRGAILIADRSRLSGDSCECYELLRQLADEEIQVWDAIRWRSQELL